MRTVLGGFTSTTEEQQVSALKTLRRYVMAFHTFLES